MGFFHFPSVTIIQKALTIPRLKSRNNLPKASYSGTERGTMWLGNKFFTPKLYLRQQHTYEMSYLKGNNKRNDELLENWVI